MIKLAKNNVSYLIIFSTVSVAVIVACYFLVGLRAFRFSDQAKAEFQERQRLLSESQELVRSLPDPDKAMEEIDNKVKEFQDLGLTKKQVPRLTQMLGQAATERNINVISIKAREDLRAGDENLPAGVAKIYMEVSVMCPYKLLAEYIRALGELPVSFNIDSVAINKQEQVQAAVDPRQPAKTETSVDLQATLIVSTYMIWEI